ncbi:MAG: hypothetical protein US72_C0002G0007 [Microgenomates group bacterium GW2011_GWC1_38_12]|uniref:Uncharacterized protein n=2 Tax=Candidatus Vogeliibacteriota TaxID=1817922 RepID=A0A1G2QEZ3_9BACT|nr:MAG: hypothetical protein US72_C0002G0007 [Microgenomates group bacterium GW2011_GWC1_38_12]KKS78113.1 MAG: hypothetical protein UV50_C0001G0023 [Parcubacteria group bacterium GW2011_GWB1_42_9]OHA59160.1 MAG: hypothetical protein A2370_03165 [Candidatus Vogelbacteria bacterium RIFOXYB1_FULL_42_16]OHA59861.1 MAG: hypothetical protein A2607_01200 [Candidatus Vogelbacteria bacterium RIFOXYD1_FULL_42_15]
MIVIILLALVPVIILEKENRFDLIIAHKPRSKISHERPDQKRFVPRLECEEQLTVDITTTTKKIWQ